MPKPPRRPRDVTVLAFQIMQETTGQAPRRPAPAVPAPGDHADRGRKGGKARAKALSTRRRKEIAKRAAASRWGAKRKSAPGG